MAWWERVCNTFRLRSLDSDLDDELKHHIALRADDLERQGWTRREAERLAKRNFGNMTLQKESMRERDITAGIETFLRDIRYAWRQFTRNPLFTAAAVLSLALGIGANTAIFHVLDAALFKSLPVPHPEELVTITDPQRSFVYDGMQTGQRYFLSYSEFVDLRDHTKTLSGLCAAETDLNRWPIRIGDGSREEARGRLLSENYFSVMGVGPAIGRLFAQTDATGVGGDPYAVLSYSYWQRRFGGDPAVLGTPIHIYGATVTIIGVASRGFRGETVGEDPDLWLPALMQPRVMPGRDWLHETPAQSEEKVMWLHVFGRLKPGVSITVSQTEMNVLFHSIIAAAYPETMAPDTRARALNQSVLVRPASSGAFDRRDDMSRRLEILLALSSLVLLIACANIANLLLARAAARFREVGIRLSIGAGKGRLVRQFLTESLLLSVLGGAAGVLVAAAGSQILTSLLSDTTDPMQLASGYDPRMLAFAGAVTLATSLLFGLAPALRATRVDINDSLKESRHGVTSSGNRLTLARILVMGQVALSLVLVAGAGLFVRTLLNLQTVRVGYAKENLLLIEVEGLTAGYKGVQLANLYHTIAGRIATVPQVRALTYSHNGLFSGHEQGDLIEVEGFTPRGDDDRAARFDVVAAGYFSTVGIPMILGRDIGPQDKAHAPRVCIVNETFASRFFANRNPIGRHVTDVWDDTRIVMEVVGVAKDARDHDLRGDILPRFYVPLDQGMGDITPSVNFEIRTNGDPKRIANAVRQAVLDVNPDLPVTTARPLDEMIARFNAQPRLIAQVCAIFGAIALILAAMGVYGVLSHNVARRTNEIGIRMALGASAGGVVGLVLRETGWMVVFGVFAGTLAAAACARLVATQLYGLEPMDPLTIAASICTLGFTALAAAVIPAMRAARVNPVSALRHE
ncbi:MAG TPA: ABC transporter permease [Bryobacteraceae bacterium]|nr:ABC transporter permease [Bryobacteraceae bacterium]